FDVAILNVTAEYNQAAPYTYQHPNNRVNYTSHGEALAHPRGANFGEGLGIATYGWNRWEVYGQTEYAIDVLAPSDTAHVGVHRFKEEVTADAFHIGQGNVNNLFYNELRFSYVMNPKYNLRWELGLIDRRNKNTVSGDYHHSTIFTFG